MLLLLFIILYVYFLFFGQKFTDLPVLVNLSLKCRPDPDAEKWSMINQLSGLINKAELSKRSCWHLQFLFVYNWKRGDEVPVSKFEVGGGLKLADVFEADLTEIYKGSKNHHLKEIARKSDVDLKVGLGRRHISPYTFLPICDV